MMVLIDTPEWVEKFGPYVDRTTELPWKVSKDIPPRLRKELEALNKESEKNGYPKMFEFEQ